VGFVAVLKQNNFDQIHANNLAKRSSLCIYRKKNKKLIFRASDKFKTCRDPYLGLDLLMQCQQRSNPSLDPVPLTFVHAQKGYLSHFSLFPEIKCPKVNMTEENAKAFAIRNQKLRIKSLLLDRSPPADIHA
jgi:hypothetical protein